MKPTKKQMKDWNEWLPTLPPEVREVAERIVPWKTYKLDEKGYNTYRVVRYDEPVHGTGDKVLVTCENVGSIIGVPFGYLVGWIDPDKLIEV